MPAPHARSHRWIQGCSLRVSAPVARGGNSYGGLDPRLGCYGDAIVDGRVDQLVERFGGLEFEVIVLRVADAEPTSYE